MLIIENKSYLLTYTYRKSYEVHFWKEKIFSNSNKYYVHKIM